MNFNEKRILRDKLFNALQQEQRVANFLEDFLLETKRDEVARDVGRLMHERIVEE